MALRFFIAPFSASCSAFRLSFLDFFFLFLWLIYNTFQFTTLFDPPPYILLNFLLSFQAAFTGPVLLIAAILPAPRLRHLREYAARFGLAGADHVHDHGAHDLGGVAEEVVAVGEAGRELATAFPYAGAADATVAASTRIAAAKIRRFM